MCENVLLLTIFKIINTIILVAQISLPIIIIVMGSIDLVKCATRGDQEELLKSAKNLVYRFIAAVIIFFLPIIVRAAMNTVKTYDHDNVSCLFNVTDEMIYIAKTKNANAAVEYAVANKSYQNYNLAVRYVNRVQNPNEKAALMETLDKIKAELDAEREAEKQAILEAAKQREAEKKQAASTSYSNATTGEVGEWATWKQDSGAPWSFTTMGNSNVGSIGCFVTSIAKQIGNSGTATSDLNPGNLATAIQNGGGFSSGGALLWNDGVSNALSKFSNGKFFFGDQIFLTGDYNERANRFAQWIKEGYYPVTEIKQKCTQGQHSHYVAVVAVEDGKIIVSDPNASADVADLLSINSEYFPGEVRLFYVK